MTAPVQPQRRVADLDRAQKIISDMEPLVRTLDRGALTIRMLGDRHADADAPIDAACISFLGEVMLDLTAALKEEWSSAFEALTFKQ